MTKDPREVLRQIIALHPKARSDQALLWRIFEAEIHDDRHLAAAVFREVAEQWSSEAVKQL